MTARRPRDPARPILSGLLILGTAIVFAPPSRAADGTFDLRWDSCAGPVDRCPTPNEANELFASVVGFDVPHKAYQIQLLYGEAATETVPDAWRFDAAGCQTASLIRIDHLPGGAISQACPALQGGLTTIQIKDVNFAPPLSPYPPTLMRIVVANTYGQNVATPDPAQRYFLMRVVFDHRYSAIGVAPDPDFCGGFETPMRFNTIVATYLDANGLEFNFRFDGTRTVTSKGSGTCVPIAAEQSTWGAIKGQYRR